MRPQDSIMILDLVDSGVIMLDERGCIVFWNQFISCASHIEFGSIEGKPLFDVFPALVDSRINKAIDKAINYNFPSILSYKLLKTLFPLYKKSLATKPPYLIVQSIIIKPIIEEGENKGCIIYINDVSAASKREEDLNHQSKKLQQALHNYESVRNEFEELFKSAHSGIIIFDQAGKIKRVNHATEAIFDELGDALDNSNIIDLLPNIKAFYNEEKQLYSLENIDDFDFEQAPTAAINKYLSLTISQMVNKKGHFFVHINDISDKHTIEERLRSANDELEEFAYRTSHDLRSPIVSSIGLLEVAREALGKQDYSTVQQCFEHSDKSLRKLEVLIRDILKLTEAKKGEETVQELNIEAMVKNTFASVENLAGFKGIDCRINLKHTQPLVSKKTRVNMILENLISNSIKYRDPDTDEAYVSIDTYIDNGNFVLSVSDNGLGIPEDQQHKLFKMFNRFHPNVAFGSGLGLYLMKKSAEVLGGDICYVQQPKGAMFKLTIPQHNTPQLH